MNQRVSFLCFAFRAILCRCRLSLSVFVCLCPSVCPSACLSASLCLCLSGSVCLCLSLCLSLPRKRAYPRSVLVAGGGGLCRSNGKDRRLRRTHALLDVVRGGLAGESTIESTVDDVVFVAVSPVGMDVVVAFGSRCCCCCCWGGGGLSLATTVLSCCTPPWVLRPHSSPVLCPDLTVNSRIT